MRALIALCLVAGSCSYDFSKLRRPTDGGADVPLSIDGPEAGGDGRDTGGDLDAPARETGSVPTGQGCTAGNQCETGFCSDGICCESACSGVCLTCAGAGREGTCVPAEAGSDPREDCRDEGAPSCGTTGLCDGAGACALYGAGTICASPGCTGSALTVAGTCDGAGTCAGAATASCTPFQCGTDGRCRTTCSTDADCLAPNDCAGGSCGKKPIGASCGAGTECNSTICAQGKCCSASCAGTCRSCALAGSEGTCRNVPDGTDPLGQCADEGAATCGLDGQCNGLGACRKYAVSTPCGMDSCSMGAERPAGRCDVAGTCASGFLRSCSPYTCGTTNCKTSCTTSADCVAGFSCIGGVCAQAANGTPCTSAAMCASGYCEQGVCCNTGCSAACQSCNLAGSIGTCTPLAAGTAPTSASQCTDMGAASCGTDGKCNGAGACRLYAAGTTCGGASCTGSTLSSPRSCDGAGTCRAATTSSCAPFQCGAGACKMSCTSTTADCTSGNNCVNMSCGKIPVGGICSSGLNSDCASGFCVNNVCCNNACTGACMSCSLADSVGTCSPIAAGDPPLVAAQCPAAAATTCGNDGTCNGAGACRKHISGTQCASASCTGSTASSPRLCDGAGSCAAATTTSCGKYACDDVTGACRTSCTANADCVVPNICNGNSCTKKPTGVACTSAAECDSGFCSQGVCCATACMGTCRSCALAGSPGTCRVVPAGQDPLNQCSDEGAATCGTDGVCDGAGGCRYYASGTICVAGSCTGAVLTPARTCDGAGTCGAVTSFPCDPFTCDPATKACRTMCSTDGDCLSPITCVNASCGRKAIGQPCTVAAECNSAICSQGVCCTTACTGTCASCALAGSSGTCTAVPSGQDPLNQCADQGVAMCGTDGSCNGSGACRRYAAGTICAASTCTGSTLTPASTCNGSGMCVTPTNVSCAPYACGAGVCRTDCASTADCSGAPYVCVGSTCGSATMLTVSLFGSTAAQWIYATLRIRNDGTTAIPLADLTMRYWYTYDTTPVVAQADMCLYSMPAGLCGNITRSWAAVTPARTNADFYYQIGFNAAAGNINAGATTEFQVGFHKNDWTNFTQTNDYSYNAATAFTTTTKVTAYRVGVLVYGTEPL